MSLTEGDKAILREAMFEAMKEFFTEQMSVHIETCPWGRKMSRFIWVGIGIGVTMSLLGVTTIPGLWHFFVKGPTP